MTHIDSLIGKEFSELETASEMLNYTSALFNLWHEMAETYLNERQVKLDSLEAIGAYDKGAEFEDFMNGKRLEHLHMVQVIATNGYLLDNPEMDETVAKCIRQHIDTLEGAEKFAFTISVFKLWASLAEIAIDNREVELEKAEDNAETDFECFLNGKRFEAMEAMSVPVTNGYLLES